MMPDLVEPVESRDKPRPATDGRKQDDCQPLLAASHLNLYRENTFRITGLPVDATEREMRRQASALKHLEEFGAAEDAVTHAYALRPSPTADQIRAAMQRLKDPELRLIDEFFWFWPKEFGKGSEDPALQALQRGDASAAYEMWKSDLGESDHGAVAAHNLAVAHHLQALDMTLSDLETRVDESQERLIRGHWKDAFIYWERIAVDDRIWSALKRRINGLGEARLTTGFARRMENTLPVALDKINAEAAVRLSEAGRMDAARWHVDFMRDTHAGFDDVDKTAALVLAPARKRVEQLVKLARETTTANPRQGLDVSANVVRQCEPLHKLFGLFFEDESHHRAELFDEVASAINTCLVAYNKRTNDFKSSNPVMRQALGFATSIHLRELLQKNLSIGEGNVNSSVLEPVYRELKQIQDSKSKAALRFAKIKTVILPALADLSEKEGANSAVLHELCESCSIVVRGIAVDAHNNDEDQETAWKAIQIAEKLARSPDQQHRVQEDRKAIEPSLAEKTCFFCAKRPATTQHAVSRDMHGDFSGQIGAMSYRKGQVRVPRCKHCFDIDAWLIAGAALFFVVGVGLGVSLSELQLAVIGLMVMACVLLIRYVIYGRPALSRHPRISHLLKTGWFFGAQPR